MQNFYIDNWLKSYIEKVEDTFSSRIEFIGIQGSFARNEATDKSDIDVVLLLDKFTYNDLKIYETSLSDLENREKVCGFISGMQEIKNWSKADLLTFYFDTIALYGSIGWIWEMIKPQDVLTSIKRDACDIYHMCVHNGIHGKSIMILKDLLKKSVFVLKAIYFYDTGEYIKSRYELMKKLNGIDRDMLELSAVNESELDFDKTTEKVMNWSGGVIRDYNL